MPLGTQHISSIPQTLGYGIDQERNPPRNEAPRRMQRVDRERHGRPVREHLNQRPVAQIICNQIARRIGDAGAGKRVGSQRLPIVDLDVAMDLDRERRATLVMERPAVTRDQLRLRTQRARTRSSGVSGVPCASR